VAQLTYLQAIVVGLLQGFTELFPVSSLGHSILVPAWIGGSWEQIVTGQASKESPYLAFIVGLHVATALALLVLFWRDWVRIIRGFFTSIAKRSITTTHERLAWLIVLATIPAGLTGLVLEHALRTLFAKPLAAAVFLTLNGVVLLAGERLRRRAPAHRPVAVAPGMEGSQTLDSLEDEATDTGITQQIGPGGAFVVGLIQTLALLAGISRSGITMVAGLLRGLTHEEALRFSFLLATPIILAAGVLKLPSLMGPLGDGIHGQALVGAVAAFFGALASAIFLVRWFKTRTLTPFAIYCLVFGIASIVKFG
jgi:undecaprenyl-diphosphatase